MPFVFLIKAGAIVSGLLNLPIGKITNFSVQALNELLDDLVWPYSPGHSEPKVKDLCPDTKAGFSEIFVELVAVSSNTHIFSMSRG